MSSGGGYVYAVQGYYSRHHGWETVCEEETRPEAIQRLGEYDENEPRYAHRIRRVRRVEEAA